MSTTLSKKPGRGGKRQGAGRKASDGATIATTIQISARIWPEQQAKYLALGGSEWLRAVIDREFYKDGTGSGSACPPE